MKYLSVKEVAILWNTSERSVRNYCAAGRVPGAFLTGKTWNIPENADKMILTVKGYSDEFNPETGKGNNSFEYTKEWSIGGHVGATKSNYNLYSFIPNDGYEVDVNIRAVNTDGEDLYNRDVTDVPLRKNQQTTIRGSLFTAGMTASISVSFQWDETITMPL